MNNTCPRCKSENTVEMGGTDHMDVFCRDCRTIHVITWQNYKARAEKLTEALKRIAEILDPTNDESYRRDDPHGAMDTAFSLADNAVKEIEEPMKDTLTKAEVKAIVVEIIGFIPKGYKVTRPRGFNAWMLSGKVDGVDLGNTEKSVRDEVAGVKDAFTKP